MFPGSTKRILLPLWFSKVFGIAWLISCSQMEIQCDSYLLTFCCYAQTRLHSCHLRRTGQWSAVLSRATLAWDLIILCTCLCVRYNDCNEFYSVYKRIIFVGQHKTKAIKEDSCVLIMLSISFYRLPRRMQWMSLAGLSWGMPICHPGRPVK